MPVELLDISISRPKAKDRPKTHPEQRRFEDGAVEVVLPNGGRLRQVPTLCLTCGREKIDHITDAGSFKRFHSGLCPHCFKLEQVAREQALAQERAARMSLGETAAQRRYVAQILATPLWRDRLEIKKIYVEAKRLSAETGIDYEVDHIYPIQSEFACGLHVHHNLRILEKGLNRAKKNIFPLFDSPALRDS
jgi:hypothetical protein